MALATLHPMFMNTSGRMGRLVYYNRRGIQCVRRHVIPGNPDTAAQRAVRSSFADAVHAWQALADQEKAMWRQKARYRNVTGYNMFVSRYMKDNLPAASGLSSGVQQASPSLSSANPPCIRSVDAGIQAAEHLHYAGMQQVKPGKG